MNEILILCRGRGKRIGEKGIVLPKPLQKINKQSILEHKIHYYYEQGIRNIILAIGYKGYVIKETIDRIKFPSDLNIKYSEIEVNAGILKRMPQSSSSMPFDKHKYC